MIVLCIEPFKENDEMYQLKCGCIFTQNVLKNG